MVLAEVVTVPNFSALTSHSTYLRSALLAIWFMLTLPSEESPSIFLSTSRSIRNVLVTVSGDLRASGFRESSSCVITNYHILWHLQSSANIKINLALLCGTTSHSRQPDGEGALRSQSIAKGLFGYSAQNYAVHTGKMIADCKRRETYRLSACNDPMEFRGQKMTLAPTRTILELKSTPVSSSRSVTRTLRLDEDVEAGIVEMAEREQFSFNLLANRALRKLVEWEDKAGKFGFIQVPTSLVEKVFSILTDEEARELGRETWANTLPGIVPFWVKKLHMENALKAMEMIGSYGNAFRLQYTIDGETDTVVLKHDRGPRVSAFYGEMVQSRCKPMVAQVETHETDGQVVATIIRPPMSVASEPRDALLIPSFPGAKNGRGYKR